jgi:hypothetical protein
MSSATDGRQASMDSTQIYREETFTDRKVGTIRRLTPVSADGGADAARPVLRIAGNAPRTGLIAGHSRRRRRLAAESQRLARPRTAAPLKRRTRTRAYAEACDSSTSQRE